MTARRRRARRAPSLAEGWPRLDALVAAASRVRVRAYAPYSRFRVGAAVIDDRGRIHTGCNVENASFGLTVCAERNAVTAAIAGGARKIRAVAVVTNTSPPGAPCGACRQVLAEVGDDDTAVVMSRPNGVGALVTTLGALLPIGFRLRRPSS